MADGTERALRDLLLGSVGAEHMHGLRLAVYVVERLAPSPRREPDALSDLAGILRELAAAATSVAEDEARRCEGALRRLLDSLDILRLAVEREDGDAEEAALRQVAWDEAGLRPAPNALSAPARFVEKHPEWVAAASPLLAELDTVRRARDREDLEAEGRAWERTHAAAAALREALGPSGPPA